MAFCFILLAVLLALNLEIVVFLKVVAVKKYFS